MRSTGALTVVLAAVTLTGCGSPSVSLASRPTGRDSGQALARLVAGTARCGDLEDYDQRPDRWAFTCQTGPDRRRSFAIWTLSSNAARNDVLGEMARSSAPIKAGAYFLVQEGTSPGEEATADALADFPGRAVDVGRP